MRGQAAGFSLVETLIALVVIAVAVAVASPVIGNAQKKRSTETAGNRFVELHSRARASAVKYGRLVELHIDASSSRLWIQSDTAGTGTPDTLGAVRDLSAAYIRLQSTYGIVCFDASGSASARGSCGSGLNEIVFSNGTYADTLRVTAAGNVLR